MANLESRKKLKVDNQQSIESHVHLHTSTTTNNGSDSERYEYKNGLRLVKPYQHVFETFVKGRWLGRELLEVLSNEFEAFDKKYFKEAIESGAIQIDGKQVGVNVCLGNNQKIRHCTVVHEPPVLAIPIKVLGEPHSIELSIIAVDKPCGVPVHPGAAYRYNSLLEIVKHKSSLQCEHCKNLIAENELLNNHPRSYTKETLRNKLRAAKQLPQFPTVFTSTSRTSPCLSYLQTDNLRPLHRLDRLTSGLVVLGTTSSIAREFEVAFRNGQIYKVYIARVIGDFSQTCKARWASNNKPLSTNFDRENDKCILTEQLDSCKDEFTKNINPGLHDACTQHDEDEYLTINKVVLRGEVCCISRKSARYKFQEQSQNEGKLAVTEFEFVLYDPIQDESILLCSPKTGRTHQLRTQLFYLGHPISNDPCYGPSQLRHRDWYPRVSHVDLGTSKPRKLYRKMSWTNEQNTSDNECGQQEVNSNDTETNDDRLHASGIFLHAWKYELKNRFSFSTDLPDWCYEK